MVADSAIMADAQAQKLASSDTKDVNVQKAEITERPTKRKKVQNACIYCRRSHMTCDLNRPCERCVKRDIGHLCHDEVAQSPIKSDRFDGKHIMAQLLHATSSNTFGATVHGAQPAVFNNAYNQATDMPRDFADGGGLHPYSVFNPAEVTNEYNLLGDFLNTSLLDDGRLMGSGPPAPSGRKGPGASVPPLEFSAEKTLSTTANVDRDRPYIATTTDATARENFYLTAADPAGNATAEERMNKVLQAKYDAGMLKPFNYVNGYARLNRHMEKNMKPASRQRIVRQLEEFRPKFREAMQRLTDVQLVKVEMWFEQSLMEYDRVFASMALPACCWRRTGEIFRGNKEMAELINVPIEHFHDGQLAIHDIIVEDSLVSYWERFGAIAFEPSQKAVLTSCSLKSLNESANHVAFRCCFSFTIRRDIHSIPSIIVGNFLPVAV